MTNYRIFFCVLALATALPLSPRAHAASETPKATVETIIEKARHLDNKATKTSNAAEIESLVDFKRLASDSLGAHLDQATPAQRKEIEGLLKGIITRTVYPEAPKFFRDVTVQFTAEEKSGSETHITSLVTKGQKRSTVEYWLVPEGTTFRVVDLAIEGERWVENVRDQFDEVIRKNGMSGLIAKMKKRLKDLEAKKG